MVEVLRDFLSRHEAEVIVLDREMVAKIVREFDDLHDMVEVWRDQGHESGEHHE
jgi:hypothetical protein